MKKRILDFLIKIGKKCKPLTYPVMIVVIAFLTIYHAIRNLFTKENKWKSLVTGAICLVAVVGAVLVLPSLADEMTGENRKKSRTVRRQNRQKKRQNRKKRKKTRKRRRMSHRQLRNRNISQQPNRMNPIICQNRKRRQLRKRGKRHRFS